MADPDAMGADVYRQWERTMSSWWDGVLETPAFLGAMGDGLKAPSRWNSATKDSVDATMAQMHLPSRSDVTRVARIASRLEDKVLALEDRLLTMEDAMKRVEKEVLAARIEAAEARVEVTEGLAKIEALLSEPTRTQPTRRRTKKDPS